MKQGGVETGKCRSLKSSLMSVATAISRSDDIRVRIKFSQSERRRHGKVAAHALERVAWPGSVSNLLLQS